MGAAASGRRQAAEQERAPPKNALSNESCAQGARLRAAWNRPQGLHVHLFGRLCLTSRWNISPEYVASRSWIAPIAIRPKERLAVGGRSLPAVVEDRPAQDATSVSQRAQSAQRALIRVGQQLHGQLLAATRCERESVPSYAWLRRAFRCERRRHGERQSRCINSPLPPVPGGERCRRRMEVRTGGVANGSRGRGQLSSDHRSTRPRQLGHAELLVSWRTHAFPCGLDGAAPPR